MKYKDIYEAYKNNEVLKAKDIPKERYFQDKIIKYLKSLPNCFVWKAQQGAYCRSGIPDICCIIGGRFYGFEVKRPWVGKLSPIQKKTIEDIKKADGRAYVVCFVEEVEEILKGEREI